MEVVLLGLAAGYTVGRPGVCGRRVETSALPVSLRSGVAIAGVSDRMANDGLLYDGWGAEGMEMLNSTSTLQDQAEDLGVNRYDAVLIVAARAKQNAFQSVDDQPGGYLGNSFGGNMGTGARRAKSKKSQVVSAIEELIGEVDETGELPDIVIPILPEEDELDEEELDEEALEAELQAAADAAAEGSSDVGAIAGVNGANSAFVAAASPVAPPAEAEAPAAEAPAATAEGAAAPSGDGAEDDKLLAGLLVRARRAYLTCAMSSASAHAHRPSHHV